MSRTAAGWFAESAGRDPGPAAPALRRRNQWEAVETALHAGPCSECHPAAGPAGHGVPLPIRSLLSPEQTAPYLALRGTRLTVVAEQSPYCGQQGRVRQ